jgi:hypothetical protein
MNDQHSANKEQPGPPERSEYLPEHGPLRRDSWWRRILPHSRKKRQMAALQNGYMEMLEMMRAVREHLDRQARVQERMADVVDRLPGALTGVEKLGRAAEEQVGVLQGLREQMATTAEHDRRMVESMADFNKTLAVMNETSRASADMVRRSERRMSLAFALFALVLVVLAGALYVQLGGEIPPVRSAPVAPPEAIAPESPSPAVSAGAPEEGAAEEDPGAAEETAADPAGEASKEPDSGAEAAEAAEPDPPAEAQADPMTGETLPGVASPPAVPVADPLSPPTPPVP